MNTEPLEQWHAEFCQSMNDLFAEWDRIFLTIASGLFATMAVTALILRLINYS